MDWGTSCTKVIVRDRYGQGDPAYVIDFGELGLDGNSHLLPSAFFLTSSGEPVIGPDGSADRRVDGVKLSLMDLKQAGPAVQDAEALSALYLAMVLRLTRKLWEGRWGRAYQAFSLRWSMNLGIPASSLEDESIVGQFERAAQAGWALAESDSDLALSTAKAAIAASPSSNVVNVVPEVAAQVAMYAKSPLRQRGLHCVVDVGAATVDTAAFILGTRDGDDVYSLLSTDVAPNGAFMLHSHRIEAIQEDRRKRGLPRSSELSSIKKTSFRVPSDFAPYLKGSEGGEIGSLLSKIDRNHAAVVKRSMHGVLHTVRKEMYPNAPAWSAGVRVFVCGGGSSVSVFGDARRSLADWWVQHGHEIARFDYQRLLPPGNLQWPSSSGSPDDFHRLSVAYGLSLPNIEIGVIVSPSEVNRVEPPSVRENSYANEDTK